MSDYRVLFIVGPGRSGSTLIGEILGQYPHVANGGELLLWWMASHSTPARRCGCGQRLDECDFWTAVSRQHSDLASPSPEVVAELYRARHFRSWLSLWWRSRRGRIAAPDVSHLMATLYEAIATVSQCSVIVDSSKSPGYRLHLSGTSIPVTTVHLQRDPRSVVNSWRQEKIDPVSPGDSLFAIHPLRATIEWIAQTLATRWLIAPRCRDSFSSLTYEDFVAAPRDALRHLATIAHLDSSAEPFLDDTRVTVTPTHNIAGNPDRRGDIQREIAPHESWPTTLPTRWFVATTLLCSPFLHRYRYPFSRGTRS